MSRKESPRLRYRIPHLSSVEDVEKYRPGGYHPVDVGDVIRAGEQQAYRVVHKLGYGGASTVWLVLSSAPFPSYFALKILCASETDAAGSGGERAILEHLRAVAPHGHPNVMSPHDSFKVSGPNGEHWCLVFPVLGPTLKKVNFLFALPGTTRRRLCQQVASAVAFLHQHGVCHSDLTASNLVFELPETDPMSPARAFELLGPIEAENIQLANGSASPHAPKQVVQTPKFAGLDYSLLSRIRVVDFGEAFLSGHHAPQSLGVTIEFFPPEVCFGHRPSSKSDIWQLACILYQIHTRTFLFGTGFRIFELLMATIVSRLGPMPQCWRGRFDFDTYGFREPGRQLNTTDAPWWFEDGHRTKPIDGLVAQKAAHLSICQQKELVQLLHDMFAYEPGERPTAEDVVRRLRSSTILDADEKVQ